MMLSRALFATLTITTPSYAYSNLSLRRRLAEAKDGYKSDILKLIHGSTEGQSQVDINFMVTRWPDTKSKESDKDWKYIRKGTTSSATCIKDLVLDGKSYEGLYVIQTPLEDQRNQFLEKTKRSKWFTGSHANLVQTIHVSQNFMISTYPKADTAHTLTGYYHAHALETWKGQGEQSQPKGNLEHMCKIWMEILNTLIYMQDVMNIMHCDVNTGNVFIDLDRLRSGASDGFLTMGDYDRCEKISENWTDDERQKYNDENIHPFKMMVGEATCDFFKFSDEVKVKFFYNQIDPLDSLHAIRRELIKMRRSESEWAVVFQAQLQVINDPKSLSQTYNEMVGYLGENGAESVEQQVRIFFPGPEKKMILDAVFRPKPSPEGKVQSKAMQTAVPSDAGRA